MFCSSCGKQLAENDRFCSVCGKAIVIDNSTSQSMPIIEDIFVTDKKPKSPYKNALIKVVLTALGICVLLQIFFILTEDVNWTMSYRVWQSVWWVIAYGFAANVAVDLYERTTLKNISISGFVLIVIGFILSTLLSWEVIDYSSLMGTLWIAAVGFTHCSRLFLLKFKSSIAMKSLFITTTILVITYLTAILMLIFEPDNDFFERIFLILIILSLFGTVATFLLNKIYKTDGFKSPIAAQDNILENGIINK